MKRHEIQAFLRIKGIALSTGTISNRSLDFLLLFKQLHEAKTDEIKALVDRNGGMILHMDGTHRSGGRVVFVLQEGHNGIVLDADLIPSEAEEHVKPILSKFKKTYGSPLVIVEIWQKVSRYAPQISFQTSPNRYARYISLEIWKKIW